VPFSSIWTAIVVNLLCFSCSCAILHLTRPFIFWEEGICACSCDLFVPQALFLVWRAALCSCALTAISVVGPCPVSRSFVLLFALAAVVDLLIHVARLGFNLGTWPMGIIEVLLRGFYPPFAYPVVVRQSGARP